jgi:hypothetical protein
MLKPKRPITRTIFPRHPFGPLGCFPVANSCHSSHSFHIYDPTGVLPNSTHGRLVQLSFQGSPSVFASPKISKQPTTGERTAAVGGKKDDSAGCGNRVFADWMFPQGLKPAQFREPLRRGSKPRPFKVESAGQGSCGPSCSWSHHEGYPQLLASQSDLGELK